MNLFQLDKRVAIAFRSSHRRCSMKKGVLRNFKKFIGNPPCQSLFYNTETLAQGISYEFCEVSKNTFFHRTPLVAGSGLKPSTLLKKRPWDKSFSVNFGKFLRTPFLQNTSGRLVLCFMVFCDWNSYRSPSKTFAVGKSTAVSIIVYWNILSNLQEHQGNNRSNCYI